MRRVGTIAGIVLLIAVLYLFKGWGNGGGGNVSFRLAFAVSVDGTVKSGFSIIDVLFYGGGGTRSGSPYQYYTTTQGIAPVIDLGSHGWLVAAMAYDGEEYDRRKRQYGLACAVPRTAPTLLDAFGREVSDLTRRRGDKRALADNEYPAFIWFPPGKPYTQAQQLCPEEFSSVIGAGIKLQSVTIELAPNGPLLKTLDIRAPWLDEIRIDQRQSFTRFGTAFKPNRQAQIETDAGLPPGAQDSQTLTSFLVDLPGWAANTADGMAMQGPGNSKETKATRTYKRGNAKIDAGLVIGDAVPGTLAIMQNLVKTEIPGVRMSTSPVDGFTVLRTFATRDNVSTIMVAFAGNATFSFVSNGVPEDEAFRLARQFNWKGMQAALPK